jgi:hypothetical protein
MRRLLTRWGLVVLAWFLLVPMARAQFLVFTVQSVDAVMDQMRHTLKLAGKEEEAKQIEGMLQAYLSDDGFKGLDTKKPLGIYLGKFDNPQPDRPPLVAFLPVTNEKDFLALLGKLPFPIPDPDKDGIRRLDLGNTTVLLKFAHSHVFVTVDEAQFKGELPDPAQFVTGTHRNHLLALTANMEKLPAELKSKMMEGLAQELKKKDKESDKEYQNRVMGAKLVQHALEQILSETKEVSVTLHHDREARKIRLDFNLTPKAGTKLAEQIKGFGGGRSIFAALAGQSAAHLFLHFPVAPELRAALDKAMEEGFQNALKEEKSFAKKAMAEKAYAVLAPTLKSDVFDLFGTLSGPHEDGKYTMLAGLRVKNGQEIEQLLKNLLNDMPEKDRANVQVDAAKIGDLSVHKLKFPDNDGDASHMFGKSEGFVVFHKDYILLAVGQHGLEDLKKAVPLVGTGSGSGQGAPLQLVLHVGRLVQFEKEEAKRNRALALAKTVFTGEGQDVIQLLWTGDTSMRLRLEMSDQLIRYFALLIEEDKE